MVGRWFFVESSGWDAYDTLNDSPEIMITNDESGWVDSAVLSATKLFLLQIEGSDSVFEPLGRVINITDENDLTYNATTDLGSTSTAFGQCEAFDASNVCVLTKGFSDFDFQVATISGNTVSSNTPTSISATNISFTATNQDLVVVDSTHVVWFYTDGSATPRLLKAKLFSRSGTVLTLEDTITVVTPGASTTNAFRIKAKLLDTNKIAIMYTINENPGGLSYGITSVVIGGGGTTLTAGTKDQITGGTNTTFSMDIFSTTRVIMFNNVDGVVADLSGSTWTLGTANALYTSGTNTGTPGARVVLKFLGGGTYGLFYIPQINQGTPAINLQADFGKISDNKLQLRHKIQAISVDGAKQNIFDIIKINDNKLYMVYEKVNDVNRLGSRIIWNGVE